MNFSQRARGFSLIEVMVGIGILSLLILFLGMAPRGPQSLESTQAAETLAEELRDLKAKAQKDQKPAALVIPRETTPYSTGYYRLEGYQSPQITGGTKLTGKLDPVFLIPGTWTTTSAFGLQPVGDFDIATWAPDHAGHYVIVFDQQGQMFTNLPTWLDTAHIMLSNNAEVGLQSVDGVDFPLLQAADQVTTVSVAGTGLVSVTSGVPDGATISATSAPQTRGPASDLPSVVAAVATSPTVTPITFYPPRPDGLPPDLDASIRVGEYLRMIVRAQDPDGDALFVRWSAERLGGPGALGRFSSAGKARMVWENGEWISTWEWTPPNDIAPTAPEQFILTCTVEDENGNTVEATLGTGAGKVLAFNDGLVIFDTQRFPVRTIMSVASDGSDAKELIPGLLGYLPSASPYGDCIAFAAGSEGLKVMNRDGSDVRSIVASSSLSKPFVSCIEWSPDGASLAFNVRENSLDPHANVMEDIYICRADGSNLRLIASDLVVEANQPSPIAWGYTNPPFSTANLTNQYLLYSQTDNSGSSRTRRFAVDGSGESPLLVDFAYAGSTDVQSGSLSRDRKKFIGVEVPSYEIVIYDVNLSSGRLENPTATGLFGFQPEFSYDASRLTYCKGSASGFEIFVANVNGTDERPVSGSPQDQGATWLVSSEVIE